MREIKFRAYWNHGFIKSETEDKEMITNWQDSRECEDVWFDWGEYYDVMQYTWLKDKNGKEIYEGDLISTDSLNRLNTVYYCTLTASFRLKYWSWDCSFYPSNKMEVTWNIYEK